jgi:hypothetical protein
MRLNYVNVNVEDNGNNMKDWYGELAIHSDVKEDIMYAQMVHATEFDVTVVPSPFFNIIKKHKVEIFDMLKEKYPESSLSAEYGKVIEYLNKL